MAQITATYRADLAEHIGLGAESFDATTVKDVLKQIKNRHGKDVYKEAKSLLITRNGLSIQKEHHYATSLAEGDIVGFYSLAAGG